MRHATKGRTLRAMIVSFGTLITACAFGQGPGDVWVGGLSTQPLFVHFAGTNRFRTYGTSSRVEPSGARVWGVKLDQRTGNIFFTEPVVGEVVRINPVTNQVTAWVVGGSGI